MPDTKDWSWVVRRPCPECGLDASLCDERLNLMLTRDDPTFANWDQDEAAATGRYGELVPAEVATEIADAAATALGSRSRRTGGTSSTRRCTTCTT